MFEQSILESSPGGRTRRGWTMITSSALQVAVLTLLVLIPVLHPEAMPSSLRAIVPHLPQGYSAGREAQPPRPPQGGRRPVIETAANPLIPPSEIPKHTYIGPDAPPAFPNSVSDPSSAGPACPSCPIGITRGMSDVFSAPPPVPHPKVAKPAPVSEGVIEGYLVQRVQPVYPHLAQVAGVQGEVVLQAVISRDGTIEQLHAVSGHPMLVPAALDAVRQWRYRPYLLSGQPVEVETQVTVRFILSGH